MKKLICLVGSVIIVFVFISIAHARNEDECACGNQNLSVAEAIKGDMGDTFDSGNAFAAGGTNFINNLPNNPIGPGKVSSMDITLNGETPAGPGYTFPWDKFPYQGGPHHPPSGCRNCELIVPGDPIFPPEDIPKE